MNTMQVTATLAPCPECKQVMVIVDGACQSKVTFWTKDQVFSMMTPHTDDCPLNGKALT